MRAFIASLLCCWSFFAWADSHDELFRSAGWTQQTQHFQGVLQQAQQSYKNTLPSAMYQALVNNSNQRFAPAAMQQRALSALRKSLPDAEPALTFYQSPLGQKIVAAEVDATSAAALKRNSQGLPAQTASATRQLLIRHLAQAIPASQAAAEVGLALTSLAADSLSQMLPGLLGGSSQELIGTQRNRMAQQMDQNIDSTLLYIYRNLSDAELEEYVSFAESPAGKQYYQAALVMLNAALNQP